MTFADTVEKVHPNFQENILENVFHDLCLHEVVIVKTPPVPTSLTLPSSLHPPTANSTLPYT